ncbi:MAG: hypothetical protein M1817_002306 [Caeruleum heppii]|nr:MAG: hypothetical protein M1817_003509 [Caeruleum heppii]KAI9673668.1 MAG: hypothetical protein M1817_002306 [Caeruleum heppii]
MLFPKVAKGSAVHEREHVHEPKTSNDLTDGEASSDGAVPHSRPKKTVSLWLFLLSIALLVCTALALGLGLGLGLPRRQGSTTVVSSTGSNFNYSSFYGIPEELPVVASDRLLNQTQLDLKTRFVVSDQPTLREYTLNISQALAAPDGFEKPMILANNQFPGPLIEANSGDTLRIHVNNQMSNWSTSVHWHGIDQKNSTWADGVASITQCGIPPGRSFTYEFTLTEEVGTFWYHSHLGTQYTDGLFGPLIIHSPTEQVPPVDEEKIVFMGDWYHTYSSVLVASYLNPTSKWANESGVEALADNLLMNGRNTYDCSVQSSTYPPNKTATSCTGGDVYVTKVESDKKYRLRLINHSTFFSFWFSVDNHTIEIVEIDGVPIEPITNRGVNVNIGQRYSVIVHANQTAGNYHMRATFPTSCFLPFVPYNSTGLESSDFRVLGIMSYDDTNPTIPTIGIAGNTTNPYDAENNMFNNLVWEGCNDMPFDMPKPMVSKPAFNVSENNMHYMEYSFRQTQNENRIFVNKTAWAPLENNATLWKAIDQNFSSSQDTSYNSWSFGLNQQVLLLPDANQGVQLVVNSLDAMEHPWHLHGHNFQIVGWGLGLYGIGNTTWNFENPMRRDTLSIPAQSHVIIRWMADNPGIWTMHCHVAWHMEGGMLLTFAERPSDLVAQMARLDPVTRSTSQGFCGVDDDQAFGTYVEYDPPELGPAPSAPA